MSGHLYFNKNYERDEPTHPDKIYYIESPTVEQNARKEEKRFPPRMSVASLTTLAFSPSVLHPSLILFLI